MIEKPKISEIPFGTLELDGAGTVLRYESDGERRAKFRASDIVGLNFFDDIAPAEQTEEMLGRFNDIMSDGAHGRRSSLFLIARPAVQIQILAAPSDGRATGGRVRSALVRIEPGCCD